MNHRQACAALLTAIETAWIAERDRLVAAHPGRKDLHRRHKAYRWQERYVRSKAVKVRAVEVVRDRREALERTEALLAQYRIPRVLVTGLPPATEDEIRECCDWQDRQKARDPHPCDEVYPRWHRRKRRWIDLFGQGYWQTDGEYTHAGGNPHREDRPDRARPELLTLDAHELRNAERRISAKVTKYSRRLRELTPGTSAHARLSADVAVWRCDLARARVLLSELGAVQATPPGRAAERARARELHEVWAQQQRAARALPTRAEQRAALAVARAAWEEARQRDAQGRALERANARTAQDRVRAEQRALAQRDRQAAAQAARRRPCEPEPGPGDLCDLICAF